MTFAAVLLGLAVLGGFMNLALRFKGGNPPLLIGFAHGTVAAAGLVALAVAVLGSGAQGLPLFALVVLGVAALIGLYVVSFHVRGRLIPLGFALFHAFVAIFGYSLLLAHVLRS